MSKSLTRWAVKKPNGELDISVLTTRENNIKARCNFLNLYENTEDYTPVRVTVEELKP